MVDVARIGARENSAIGTISINVQADGTGDSRGEVINLQETRRKYYLYADRQSIPFVLDGIPCTYLNITATVTIGTKVSRLKASASNDSSECYNG